MQTRYNRILIIMNIIGLFVIVIFPRCIAQCSGPSGHGCCAGFRWNSAKDKCVECPTGFHGFNCSIACRFPSFGESCQKICKCPERLCDNVLGCTEHMANETRDSDTKNESPMIDVSILLSALAVVIICCYTGKKILIKLFERQKSVDEEKNEPEPERQADIINIPDYQSLREMNLSQIRGTLSVSTGHETSSSDGSDFSYIDVNINRNTQRYYQNVSSRRQNVIAEEANAEEIPETSQRDIILTPSRLVYSNPSGGRPQYENQEEESYVILQPNTSRSTQ